MEDNLDPLKSKDNNDNSLKSFPNTNNNKNISSSSEEKSSEVKLNPETQKLKDNVSTTNNVKVSDKKLDEVKIKPKKELPVEKKPFIEFVNEFLLPSLNKEFEVRGLNVEKLILKNTYRPIAGDKCWVICCEIKDTCNFWLSFEKDDITSLKSISLSKSNQKPSVIESFLIDEKRITLQLIISRILQRLNGQKLIGIN